MARARNIKPSLFKNELLGVADPLLSLLFVSLWCLADRKGRLEDRPLRIKAETFAYREGLDINGYLTELQRLGFIRRYKSHGLALIQVENFEKHQNPHKTEKHSEYPEYSEDTDSCALTVKVPLNNGCCPADSLLLIPDSLIPDSLIPDSLSLIQNPPAAIAPVKKNDFEKISTECQEACKTVWAAYSKAYFVRYQTAPVRNAKVSSQVKLFVQRIGLQESPQVAAFYVAHNERFYVQKAHPIDLLLKDAEGLRTQWATGKSITGASVAGQSQKDQAREGARAMLFGEKKIATL